MANRVELKTELPVEELHERYRQPSEAVERTHWQILWLMKQAKTPAEVAERVGYSARWVGTVVGRYNRQGMPGMSNHRLTRPGAKPLLNQEQQEPLEEAFHKPPANGGLWSGPKVAQGMQEQLGRPVDARRGWDYLQPLGYSSRLPRPKHADADQAAQQAFQKTCRSS